MISIVVNKKDMATKFFQFLKKNKKQNKTKAKQKKKTSSDYKNICFIIKLEQKKMSTSIINLEQEKKKFTKLGNII